MSIFCVLILTFLVIFSVFQLYLLFCSSKYKSWKVHHSYQFNKPNHRINVVIYSHNAEQATVELLENLKHQDYPLEKMNINIILDNCTDNSSNLLEIMGGANLYRINTGHPIGKEKAFELFIEKALNTQTADAFLFLSTENKIPLNLLSATNNALADFEVAIGIICHQTKNKFLEKLFNFYDKLYCNIILKGRTIAELGALLPLDVFAIKQTTLEKIKFVKTPKNPTSIEYSFALLKENVQILYSDEIFVYQRNTTTLKSFIKERHQELKHKLKFFFTHLDYLITGNFKTKELLLSLIYPTECNILILFLVFLSLSHLYTNLLNSFSIQFAISFCMMTIGYCIFLAKLNFSDFVILPFKMLLTPLIITGIGFEMSFPSKIFSIPKVNLKLNFKKINIFKLPKFLRKPPKTATKVILNNGIKDIECKLEIQKKEKFFTAILWVKNKRIFSNSFFKAAEAVEDLSNKLFSRGFIIKICQNCGYFLEEKTLSPDNLKANCLLGMSKHEQKEPYSTKITNGCKFIIPAHAREHIRKQIENKLKKH